MLTTLAELTAAFADEPRLADWTLGGKGDGFLELQRGNAALVLVWPALWRDRAALAPHLVRARTGRFALVLVGSANDLDEPVVAELAAELPRVLLFSLPTTAGTLAVW